MSSAPAKSLGALAQSVNVLFIVLYVVLAIMLLGWLSSGIVQVEAGMTAVVLRNGAIDRQHGPGLVLAWPRPFEEVVTVPGHDRQLTLHVTRLDILGRDQGVVPEGMDPRRDGGYVLTGDAGVIHIDGTITYAVVDAAQYMLSRERVEAGLTRLFCTATVAACAGRTLDGVMVARPDLGKSSDQTEFAQSRDRLRGEIAKQINERLSPLGFGVAVGRVDLSANLPEQAKEAFIAVADAESAAATEIASAKTSAETTTQGATSDAEVRISNATADAEEIITQVHKATDPIAALENGKTSELRALMLERIYRERIETIIHKCKVELIDGSRPVKLAIPADKEPDQP
jgi:regulator of protease activity HflC (stomatin/prohibitin superfamily)